MKPSDCLYSTKSLSIFPPHWFRRSSIAMLASSIALLCLSLFADNFNLSFAPNLVPSLLVALGFTALLNFYSVWYLRKEYRQADEAFRDTDCEFSSIFQNVLDGILIINDKGTCIDGNPAAARMLRINRSELIGKSIGAFFADSESFSRKWRTYLQNKTDRGRAELVAGDGTTVFVDFTAAANYLPRRHIFI